MPCQCSTPRSEKLAVDVFVVYTDSETWHGTIHPFQALEAVPSEVGHPGEAGGRRNGIERVHDCPDPSDAGMMDVVGFDTSAPAVMADFARN